MITKTETAADIKAFAKQLRGEGVSFHRDDDFNDYVNFKENTPTYSKEDVDLRNDLMNQCFDVCEKECVDIYALMLESLIETGMNKFIPLPSQLYSKNN